MIDKSMRNIIKFINDNTQWKTVACCSGHGRYPPSIVLKHHMTDNKYEVFSDIIIPRKKRFYKKDKKGYYYIPEVLRNKGKKQFLDSFIETMDNKFGGNWNETQIQNNDRN